jgi:soluble lytic murein transglycosylase
LISIHFPAGALARLGLALLLCAGLPAHAALDDRDFMAARDAHAKGQADKFNRAAAKVAADHPLQAYLHYWRLKSESADAAAMEAFVARYADSPLAERLRLDLARQYGQANDWPAFNRWATQLAKPDVEIRCHALRARHLSGDAGAAGEGAQLYLAGRDLPSSCDGFFDLLFAQGQLHAQHRQTRLRLALEADNRRLARELYAGIPDQARALDEALGRAERDAARIVAEAPGGIAREAVFHALANLAKADPAQAAGLWEKHQGLYTPAEQQYGWARIATQAARQLHPDADEWFMKAGASLGETQALWKARAMLRAGRWPEVYRTIEAMPENIRAEAVWRYWKARALKAVGAIGAANALFAPLSREIHYYGVLAGEELPVRAEATPQDYRPNPDELKATRALPGIERALRLKNLGLMVEATAEWQWALRGMNDAQILAAAEVARQETWYDRAINTAETTRDTHNFDLRYLTPFRDLAEAYARRNDLDPAWVFGLMRQESRFVDYARSSAGAMGLMQIMPSTARWIAKQLGDKHAHAQVREPATNIRFGTFYLKSVHDRLGGSPVLASAAYNAGPGRARKWQAATPLEGAIYVESIPFNETREYVKKVLVNAVFYSQRLGTPATRLKDRLGTIPARADAPAGSFPEEGDV